MNTNFHKRNEKHFRKLIQTALQDNNWHEYDKLCDWDWLLYRIRMGGNAIRMMGNLNVMFHSSETITKEDYMKLMHKYITPTNEDYDKLLEEKYEQAKSQ